MGLVAHNYLVVKPKEVTFFQLIRLLFSSRLKNISFIDCSEEEGEKLRDFTFSIVLFASALLQSLLEYFREPMSKIGDNIEYLFNSIAYNGGISKFVANIISGTVVPVPDIAPKLIGNLDSRMDLDHNIKPGDEKYTGALAMMASKLAYERPDFIKDVVENQWRMKFVNYTAYYNATSPEMVVVAFRGTDPFDADGLITDIDLSHYEIQNVGRVHCGFFRALGLRLEGDGIYNNGALYGLMEMLNGLLSENPEAKFIVTGHSLGGALALLFAVGLAMVAHGDLGGDSEIATKLLNKLDSVYTYGQPRIGDERFRRFFENRFKTYNVTFERYVYGNDIVPRIPFDNDSFEYKHVGKCYYFDRHYKRQVLEEAPNKNYFALSYFPTMLCNAVLELYRSFTIQNEYGSEYKENWLQIFVRVSGLFFPGLSAHGTQDYVNLTRVGVINASGPEHSIEIPTLVP